MKFLLFLSLSLSVLGAATLSAEEKPSITITARYQSLDPGYLTEATQDPTGKMQDLTAPRVTTRAGQRATIEVIKEFVVNSSTHEAQPMNCGVTLEVEPDFKDGKIFLSGKSTVRRHETPTEKQPLNAISFTTRETFFDGEVADDEPLTLPMGDGVKDPSRVIISARRVEPSKAVHTTHTGTPKFRVFAVEPSPEEARKPVYITLGIMPPPSVAAPPTTAARDSSSSALVEVVRPRPELDIRGIIDPVVETADRMKSTLGQVADSALKPLSTEEMPLTIDGTVGPDGYTVDLLLRPKSSPTVESSTSVSIYWGSDVYLTMADAAQPTGRRGLLIRQE